MKLFKGALILAAAIGAIRLVHRDIAGELTRWIERFNADTQNPVFQKLLSKIAALTPHKLSVLCTGGFVYSGLFLTEGIGLFLQKRWAEWFTVIITGSFLPLEIYELTAKHFGIFKLLLLIANVAIFIYLIWRLKHDREKGGITPQATSAPGFQSSP